MPIFCLILAAATLTPVRTVAPFPCETEDLSFSVAKWERLPQESRWVSDVSNAWASASSTEVTFKRPWRWYFRRTALRLDGVAADFTLTVNGKAVGESKGTAGVLEFDLTPHLKWFGANHLSFALGKTADGGPVFRHAYLVSTHSRAPRELKVETWIADDFRQAKFKVLDEKGTVLKERTIPNPVLWSDEIPAVCLTPIEHSWGWWIFGGTEYRSVKFGFKKTEVKDGKVFVNGRPARLCALAPHRTTPGFGGQPTTARKMVQDLTFIKGLNANAVFAADYPKTPEWYELCDRDGVYVIAGEDEATPADRPCVLRLPKAQMPPRTPVPAEAKGLVALKTAFSPVRALGFDWASGVLKIRNDYRFCDLDRLDGVSWRSYGADGKEVAKGPLALLKLQPGAVGEVSLKDVKGEKIRVEFVMDDDAIVRQEFTKGK